MRHTRCKAGCGRWPHPAPSSTATRPGLNSSRPMPAPPSPPRGRGVGRQPARAPAVPGRPAADPGPRRPAPGGQRQGPAQLTPESPQLKGQLRADQGRFDFSRADAPSLADDVVVQRGPVVTAERATRRAPRVPPRSISTSILATPSTCSAAAWRPSCAAKLHLGQRDNKAGAHRQDPNPRRPVPAYGQRLDIEQGELFSPALATTPRSTSSPPPPQHRHPRRCAYHRHRARTARRLSASPSCPETEKLWLLLGRGPDGLGRTDAASAATRRRRLARR